MNKRALIFLAITTVLCLSPGEASVPVERCEHAMDDVYPTLPDLAPPGGEARGQPILKGRENLRINESEGNTLKNITVHYPAASYDPGSMVRLGLPYGGIEFKSRLEQPRECLILTYELKFDNNFNFVKGGKLPGLYGGVGNTGGKIPTGYDGFSTRFIWKEQGVGAMYAYLPSSQTWGTAIGRGAWVFTVGQWQTLEQLVQLNTPGRADGAISIWHNGQLVVTQSGLVFRLDRRLKVDGLLFSTFFGGNNASFATPVNTNIQFRNFVMRSHRPVKTAELRRSAR